MGQEGMTPEVAKKFKYWQTQNYYSKHDRLCFVLFCS